MKKIILGSIAAFALTAFLAPIAKAEDAAGGDAPKADKKEKKSKKKKGGDKAEGGDAAGDAKK
jgi:hypothetical protein